MDEINSLYVYRSLYHEDAELLVEWAVSQGIETHLPSYDFHVTVMYSDTPLPWNDDDRDEEHLVITGEDRSVGKFGKDNNAIVLKISSDHLTNRHQELLQRGAVSDFVPYQAHITITYKGEGVDVSQISAYTGDIRLNGEWWQPTGGNPYSKEQGDMNTVPFHSFGKAQVLKVHPSLGLVVGYAIVSKIGGEDYFDFHNDHIPEDSMLKAAIGFMKNSRVSGDMHERTDDNEVVKDGEVVFAFPMTTDIAKSLGITVEKTGLLVGLMPSPEVLKKFESGEYTGFSIGGSRIIDEEI